MMKKTERFKSGDKIELDPTRYNPSTIVLRGTELWVARSAYEEGRKSALREVSDLWRRYLYAAAASHAAEKENWKQFVSELKSLGIKEEE